MRIAIWLIACPAVAFGLGGLSACGDDDPAAPQPDFSFEPEMSEMWPNEDGNTWIFSSTGVVQELPGLTGHASVEDVPPLPTFEELYASLREPAGHGDTRTGSTALQFDGMHEYLAGVQVIQAPLSGGPEPPMPFTNEEALWRLEEDRIAGYSEYQEGPSWIYLTSDLQPGDGFFLTIYEGLEYDITLKGIVWRHLQVLWDGQEISCVEVLYLLDRGIEELETTVGSAPEYFSSYAYGSVVYGKGVGPVSWREKAVWPPYSVTQDLGAIEPAKLIDVLMTLESVDLVAADGLPSRR